jgi:hypothetical protein
MNVNKDATYLGDGVYVRNDGYHIILITDGNTIYLDSGVLTGLLAYVEKLNKEGAEHGNDDTT